MLHVVIMDLNAYFFSPLIGDEPKWSWTSKSYYQMNCNLQRLNHFFAGKKKTFFSSSSIRISESARVFVCVNFAQNEINGQFKGKYLCSFISIEFHIEFAVADDVKKCTIITEKSVLFLSLSLLCLHFYWKSIRIESARTVAVDSALTTHINKWV